MKWVIQELEANHHGYSDWRTYMIRDAKTNVALAEVGHIDHYNSENNAVIARLVAAAPDLLEALKEIHKLWCCPEPKKLQNWSARCDCMADLARTAIAKAEGRE